MAAAPENYDALPMDWVGDWAGRRAKIAPRRRAVYESDTDRRYSFGEINERANRVGTYLVDKLGLQKGDRVCFIGRNRIEPIDLYMACGKTGIILSPLSYRLTKRELDELMERIEPQALFYEDVFSDLVDSLSMPDTVREVIQFGDGDCRYGSEVMATEPRDVNVPLAMQDTFLYIHTGGTTATPKVCIVSHRQMVWNSVDLIVSATDAMTERSELLIFPFFHIGGWNTLTPIFQSGGYSVLMRQFDPGVALDLIEQEKINHMGAVEAMLKFMADHPRFNEVSLESLTGITTAGAPCAAVTMKHFWDRGVPVSQSYGLTEAGPSNFVHTGLDESWDELTEHHASIGTSFYHCDYRIVDEDTLEPVPQGEEGVLLMRSLHNFGGYLKQPERNEKVFVEGGWIYSGDRAREDENGYVYLVGRADNMFVSGGENVSPEEIENVLTEHPAVAQAAVIPMNDERWGQVPLAVVVPAQGEVPGEDDLTRYCNGQLARYKVPKKFVVTDSLPLTGAGKIDRKALVRSYAAS